MPKKPAQWSPLEHLVSDPKRTVENVEKFLVNLEEVLENEMYKFESKLENPLIEGEELPVDVKFFSVRSFGEQKIQNVAAGTIFDSLILDSAVNGNHDYETLRSRHVTDASSDKIGGDVAESNKKNPPNHQTGLKQAKSSDSSSDIIDIVLEDLNNTNRTSVTLRADKNPNTSVQSEKSIVPYSQYNRHPRLSLFKQIPTSHHKQPLAYTDFEHSTNLSVYQPKSNRCR